MDYDPCNASLSELESHGFLQQVHYIEKSPVKSSGKALEPTSSPKCAMNRAVVLLDQ